MMTTTNVSLYDIVSKNANNLNQNKFIDPQGKLLFMTRAPTQR